jgi:hypothetical protein
MQQEVSLDCQKVWDCHLGNWRPSVRKERKERSESVRVAVGADIEAVEEENMGTLKMMI